MVPEFLEKKFDLIFIKNNFISKTRIFFNHILTIFTNFLYKQKLSDAHTCYKSFKSNYFQKIDLKEKDFAFCPEITDIFKYLRWE